MPETKSDRLVGGNLHEEKMDVISNRVTTCGKDQHFSGVVVDVLLRFEHLVLL